MKNGGKAFSFYTAAGLFFRRGGRGSAGPHQARQGGLSFAQDFLPLPKASDEVERLAVLCDILRIFLKEVINAPPQVCEGRLEQTPVVGDVESDPADVAKVFGAFRDRHGPFKEAIFKAFPERLHSVSPEIKTEKKG